ncbi:MAG: VOC family protein [Planctomycetota bacterium]|nr:VOC family protein [Planctomycetota bacterium]
MYVGSNVTVMVADLDRAVRWYTETVGLTLGFRAADEWAEIQGPNLTIGLHQAGESGPQPSASESISIGLQVVDFAQALGRLQTAGVVFEGKPVEDGPVRLAFFRDPDGTQLYVCQAVR